MAKPGGRPPALRLGSKPGDAPGSLALDDLLAVAETARELGLERVFLTSGQRLMFPGLTAEQETALSERHGHLVVSGHDLVQACPGAGHCRFAKGSTADIGAAVETVLRALDLPAKVKVGISACANCCAESRVRDLGFVAGARGWTVLFGGNAGKNPRLAQEIGRELSALEAVELARDTLKRYAQEARPGERTSRYLARTLNQTGGSPCI